MRRKIFKSFLIFLGIIGLISCGGKMKEARIFGEKFASYANSNQMDSIRAVYPTANFEEVLPLSTDSISVEEEGDGNFRINFSSGKWIDIEIDGNGNITVLDSKGVAKFPEEKYEIAMQTGMLNNSTTDVKAQELLNDEGYFVWLSKNMKQPITLTKGKISKKSGVDLMGRMCEGAVERMTCTVTNNTDKPISGKDYEITYEYSYWNCSDGSVPDGHAKEKKKGVDLGPGESATINIAIMDYGLKNVELKYNVPVEQLYNGMNPYTGNEYQEYLKEAAENSNTNFDWLSTREVTPKDLENKTKEQLRIMRNWIYARHGYIFKSPDLQEYFSQFSWYEPTSSNVTPELNKIELSNIQLIQAYE